VHLANTITATTICFLWLLAQVTKCRTSSHCLDITALTKRPSPVPHPMAVPGCTWM
jgi:hypothetical protein